MQLLTLLRASPWIAILVLLAVVSGQSSQIHRWHKQAVGLSAKLEALSTAKNEQQIVTRDNIKAVHEKVRTADDKARVIEQAPVPGGCVTKPEVMNADI